MLTGLMIVGTFAVYWGVPVYWVMVVGALCQSAYVFFRENSVITLALAVILVATVISDKLIVPALTHSSHPTWFFESAPAIAVVVLIASTLIGFFQASNRLS